MLFCRSIWFATVVSICVCVNMFQRANSFSSPRRLISRSFLRPDMRYISSSPLVYVEKNGNREYIDVKPRNDGDNTPVDTGNKGPLAGVKEVAKNLFSKFTGLFKKKEDPMAQAMNQVYDEADKVLGSRNPFTNPVGAMARGILKPMLNQMGKALNEAAKQSAAMSGNIDIAQKEALQMILRNAQCRNILRLSSSSSPNSSGKDDLDTIFYDKSGHRIVMENVGSSSSSGSDSATGDLSLKDWQSSPPFSMSNSHVNINGVASQRFSLEYVLTNTRSSEVINVQLAAKVLPSSSYKQSVEVEKLIVLFPLTNKTIRIR